MTSAFTEGRTRTPTWATNFADITNWLAIAILSQYLIFFIIVLKFIVFVDDGYPTTRLNFIIF